MENIEKSISSTTIIIGGILIAGVSFFGGMKYAASKSTASATPTLRGGALSPQGFGTGANRRGGAGFGGGNGVNGEILTMDSNSLTVKLRDGGSKIVFFSSTTPVMKTVQARAQDLSTGANVMVFGTTNPDGSLSAQSVQLRPANFPSSSAR